MTAPTPRDPDLEQPAPASSAPSAPSAPSAGSEIPANPFAELGQRPMEFVMRTLAMMPESLPAHRGLRVQRFRDRAMEYAAHGWPVAALAVPRAGVCPCTAMSEEPKGPHGGCVDPHLVTGRVVTDPDDAEREWADHGWAIALVTSRFDVLDLPPSHGAPLNHRLTTRCPTAMAPRLRRWHFVLAPGSISPDTAAQVSAIGGLIRTGPNDWLPASPTWTEETGRTGWVVAPKLTQWQPFRPYDDIAGLFAGSPSPRSVVPPDPRTDTDNT
jgi:hypothetical protein